MLISVSYTHLDVYKRQRLTGVPKPIETTDRVTCIVEYRDGTVIDVIRQVKR